MIDDYPLNLKNAPKDSIVDPWLMYNRECTSWAAWCCAKWGFDIGKFRKSRAWQSWNAENWDENLADAGFRAIPKPLAGGKYVGILGGGNVRHVVASLGEYEGARVRIYEYNYGSLGNFGTRLVSPETYKWMEIVAPNGKSGAENSQNSANSAANSINSAKNPATVKKIAYSGLIIATLLGFSGDALNQFYKDNGISDPNKILTPEQTENIKIPVAEDEDGDGAKETLSQKSESEIAIERCELVFADCDVKVIQSYDAKTGAGTLWFLAENATGDGQNWTKLLEFNKENIVRRAVSRNLPADGHWIFAGQKIVAPTNNLRKGE